MDVMAVVGVVAVVVASSFCVFFVFFFSHLLLLLLLFTCQEAGRRLETVHSCRRRLFSLFFSLLSFCLFEGLLVGGRCREGRQVVGPYIFFLFGARAFLPHKARDN